MENPCSSVHDGVGFPSLEINEKSIPSRLFLLDEKECFSSHLTSGNPCHPSLRWEEYYTLTAPCSVVLAPWWGWCKQRCIIEGSCSWFMMCRLMPNWTANFNFLHYWSETEEINMTGKVFFKLHEIQMMSVKVWMNILQRHIWIF